MMSLCFSHAGPAPCCLTYELHIQSLTDGRMIYAININSDFYSKTNQMHNISHLFYFGTTFYMFRMLSPSIIRGPRLYIQYQVYVVHVLWLFAGKQPQCGMMLCVQSQTPDIGRRDRPKHV